MSAAAQQFNELCRALEKGDEEAVKKCAEWTVDAAHRAQREKGTERGAAATERQGRKAQCRERVERRDRGPSRDSGRLRRRQRPALVQGLW